MHKRTIIVAIVSIALLAVSEREKSEHVLATRAADVTRGSALVHRGQGRAILSTFAIAGDGTNGAAGTIQPGAGEWDERSDRVSADRQINAPPNGEYTTAVSNAAHDAPGLALLADGSVVVPYGAASTYPGYHPPASWACGGRTFCEPFKFASADASDLTDALAASPQFLLPSIGLSEPTAATIGDATMIAGQQQTLSRYGQTGAQGYVSVHATRGRVAFDTTSGPWDFREQRSPAGDGLEMVTRAPNDDAYVTFGIQSSAGSGTIALTIDGAPCVQNVGGSPQDAATQFVAQARATCAPFRTKYDVRTVSYDPLERGAAAIVGVTLRHGDVSALPGAAAVTLQCSGGLACGTPAKPNAVFDERASGLHRHFMFGGVTRLGRYIYDLLDVQVVTGGWNGAAHNSYALALACFRTDGARGATWRWTDCSGRHPFSVAPGQAPVDRINANSPYLLAAPGRGYDSRMTPYIYDWSMNAQPPTGTRTYPVISSEDVALDGSTLMIVHGCQLRDASLGICYATYDTAQGRTMRAGIVDAPPAGGSLASIALATNGRGELSLGALAGNGPKWGCNGAGPCALVYAYDRASGQWRRHRAESLGGVANAGFPGIVHGEGSEFLFTLREVGAGPAHRIVTFERAAP